MQEDLWASSNGQEILGKKIKQQNNYIKLTLKPFCIYLFSDVTFNSCRALPENFRCNICWKDSSTFLVGWVDSVRVCRIRKRTPQEIAADRDKPEFIVDLGTSQRTCGLTNHRLSFFCMILTCLIAVSTFETDFYISGIGPLDDTLVILGFAKEPDEDNKSQRPVMYVVEPQPTGFVELRYDSLSLRGYQHLTCNDYHLGLSRLILSF